MSKLTATLLICVIIVPVFLFLLPITTNAQVIVINEVSSYEISGDWVELYSPDTSLDISGYRLTHVKQDGNEGDIKTFDSGTLIGSETVEGKWLAVSANNYLDRDGDTIRLHKPDGSVETFSYGDKGGVCAPDQGQSVGRYPDGNSAIERFSSLTKDSENLAQFSYCPTPAPTPSSPSPDPTPISTPAPPTPTKTPTPTPKPTVKPTPNVLAETTEEQTPPASQISDLRSQLAAPTPTPMVLGENKKKFPVLSVILIILGIGLISIPAFLLFKNIYNNKNEESL